MATGFGPLRIGVSLLGIAVGVRFLVVRPGVRIDLERRSRRVGSPLRVDDLEFDAVRAALLELFDGGLAVERRDCLTVVDDRPRVPDERRPVVCSRLRCGQRDLLARRDWVRIDCRDRFRVDVLGGVRRELQLPLEHA